MDLDNNINISMPPIETKVLMWVYLLSADEKKQMWTLILITYSMTKKIENYLSGYLICVGEGILPFL